MIAFKILYLVLSLVLSVVTLSSLIGSWEKLCRSQRLYLAGFLVLLSGLTQRSSTQVFDNQPFPLASRLVLVGLAIISVGVLLRAVPKLAKIPDEEPITEQLSTIDTAVVEKIINHVRESNKLLGDESDASF